MSSNDFALFLHMPNDGHRIFTDTLCTFTVPSGYSLKTYIQDLYIDGVADLYNEKVHLFTPQAQVIAKIIFQNLVPKDGEFDRARGCVSILIYCFLAGIPVIIPRLILDQITSANQATTTRGLSFGKIFSQLFAHIHIPVAGSNSLPPIKAHDTGFYQ